MGQVGSQASPGRTAKSERATMLGGPTLRLSCSGELLLGVRKGLPLSHYSHPHRDHGNSDRAIEAVPGRHCAHALLWPHRPGLQPPLPLPTGLGKSVPWAGPVPLYSGPRAESQAGGFFCRGSPLHTRVGKGSGSRS